MRRVVQRTPNLGLSIRLQRLAADSDPLPLPPTPDPDPDPEPTGCPCSATAVTWGEIPAYKSGALAFSRAIQGSSMPYTEAFTVAPSADAGDTHTWTLCGIPLGDAVGGVVWDIAWAVPPSFGESASSSGPLLIVSLPPAPGSEGFGFNSLTATARCGETVIGELSLTVMRPPPL